MTENPREKKKEEERNRMVGVVTMEPSPNSLGSHVSLSLFLAANLREREMNRRYAPSHLLAGRHRRKTGRASATGEVTKEVGKMRGSETTEESEGESVGLFVRLFFLSTTFYHSSPLSTGINNGLPLLPWQLSKR